MEDERNGTEGSSATVANSEESDTTGDVPKEESQQHFPPPQQRLDEIAAQIKNGQRPRSVTVRELLAWFGYLRRGAFAVYLINSMLGERGLSTDPDYRSVWLDVEIAFVPAPVSPPPTVGVASREELPPPGMFDPTYRLHRLAAANNPPVSVSRQQSVKEALTIMMLRDFSQLPVMSSERTVEGIISLSSLGKRAALGAKCETVQDCLETAHVVRGETALFDAINDIIIHEYVLVQGADRRITGIVTTSDLSLEFRQLAESYLLIAEIEQQIRTIVERGNFTADELRDCRDERDASRDVSKVSDLTFGEYVRLLENSARWQRLQLNLDRKEIIKDLQRIREIRNDVMHFDPDPLDPADLKLLGSFTAFLQDLRQIVYR